MMLLVRQRGPSASLLLMQSGLPNAVARAQGRTIESPQWAAGRACCLHRNCDLFEP